MKKGASYLVMGMLMLISSGLFPTGSLADNELLEGTEIPKKYLMQISGTVMNETFSGAQALLTLLPPAPGGNSPYQITIEGFPKKNSRNSFFWNSNYSDMTAIANEITCEIKRTFFKQVPMHFLFLSPELMKHGGTLENLGDEAKKAAIRVALPTLVYAQAGKLRVRIYSNSLSGSIWMKGYDPVEKAFVLYSAQLHGRKTFNLVPKQEVRKGTTGGGE